MLYVVQNTCISIIEDPGLLTHWKKETRLFQDFIIDPKISLPTKKDLKMDLKELRLVIYNIIWFLYSIIFYPWVLECMIFKFKNTLHIMTILF